MRAVGVRYCAVWLSINQLIESKADWRRLGANHAEVASVTSYWVERRPGQPALVECVNPVSLYIWWTFRIGCT